jgi:hypothetical protein
MPTINQDILSAANRVLEADPGLDFTPASLELIEKIFDEASAYFGEVPPQQGENMIQSFGCYVLEVAKREFGGRYTWSAERMEPVLIVGEPKASIALMCWDKIRRRLKGDAGENIPYFYHGFTQKATSPAEGENILIL